MSRLSALFLLVLGSIALGPSDATGKDEIPFAEKLADEGYLDLARDVCTQIAADPGSSPAVKAAIQLVQARIDRSLAESELDPKSKDKHFEDAVRDLEEYVRANPDGPQTPSAQLRIGEFQQARGQALVEALKAHADKEERAAIVAVADSIFQSATNLLQKLIQAFRDAPHREPELMHARYLACIGYYFHASLFIDDPARQAALAKQAVSAIDDMQWNYEETLVLLYDLRIYQGLALQCTKEYDKAMGSFRSVTDLYKLVQNTPALHDSYVVGIISRAHYLAAACANEARLYKEAIDSVDALLLRCPEVRDERFGLAARIEKGKAQAACGLTAEALKSLNDVVAVGGFWGSEAAAIVHRLSGDGGASFPPDVYLSLADSAMRAEDYPAGIRNALLARAAVRGDEEATRLIPLALQRIGACYQRLDRPYEAALAYGEIARRYPAVEGASRAAFEAARCWSAIAGTSGAPGDDARYAEALDLLTRTFPDSREARNVQFLVARRLEDKAREDPALFLKAAEEYAKVDPAAGPLHDVALLRIGYCTYQHARAAVAGKLGSAKDEADRQSALAEALPEFERAAQSCTDYLAASAQEIATDPRSVEESRELRYGGMDCLAHIWLHPAVHAHEKVLALLQNVHIEFADNPEKIAKSCSLMIQAEIALGRITEAEERCARMLQQCAGAKRLPAATRDVAVAFQRRAEELAATDPAAASDARRKAARTFAAWLAESRKCGETLPLAELGAAAEQLHALAISGRDEDACRSAVDALRSMKVRIAAGETLALEPWQLDWKLAECLLVLGEVAECRTLLEKLRTEHPDQAIVQQELAEAYASLAEQGEAGCREQAVSLAAGVLGRIENGSETWWRSQALLGRLLFDAGRYEELAAKIRTLRLAYASFDGGQWSARETFALLEQKLSEKGIATNR